MEIDTEIIVRKMRKQDTKKIWEIRNNPMVRILSRFKKKIPFEDHCVWIEEKYFGDKNNFCFVLELKELVVAYCRFDLKNEQYYVSIAVDPKFQGKGFGRRLLTEAIEQLNSRIPISAEIKENNLESVLFFQRNGFSIKTKNDNFLILVR